MFHTLPNSYISVELCPINDIVLIVGNAIFSGPSCEKISQSGWAWSVTQTLCSLQPSVEPETSLFRPGPVISTLIVSVDGLGANHELVLAYDQEY